MDSQSPPSTSGRKSRENETPTQRDKREKAAERQRRKRERDRQVSGVAPRDFPHYPHPEAYISALPPAPVTQPPPQPEETLSPHEWERRERVRAAARERQRKHRLLVKQRKLRALALEMGNALPEDGADAYGGELAMQQHAQAQAEHQAYLVAEAAQARAHASAVVLAEEVREGQPVVQAGQAEPSRGGETFATTLLISLSCALLLKQHLLHTLHMTDDELASLQPVIADAWDRWDQARR
ncbi:hypothetical protein B0H15DRAFT_804904 [Mycena belliarum]|uniref:Uncharacterized protein n=1 Tax=Mycena belliarum TaxID=1033014 RepID=A0AAD6XPA8_9AGAR|nr:hypothetical protein B0H15DRAFT_804904 [Mycena belliae]